MGTGTYHSVVRYFESSSSLLAHHHVVVEELVLIKEVHPYVTLVRFVLGTLNG